MLKIFKYLKYAIPQVLLITVLLIIQAWGDLTLPQYTSNIVDIGIQQGGVENAVADAISEESYNSLSLFMSDEDKQLFSECYTLKTPETVSDDEKSRFPKSAEQNVYFKNQLSAKTAENLNSMLCTPMMICKTLEEMSFDDFKAQIGEDSQVFANTSSYSDILKAMGIESDENANALDLINAFCSMGMQMTGTESTSDFEKLKDMPESILTQGAAGYVRNEYTALGVDADALQQNYLLSTGGAMLIIALVMMAVSVCVGFIASRVAAGVGMRLRSAVFKNVVGFSSAEIDKFSTASLITRSTNDIQQIQMVIVMLLRMVMYAPILGIGGVFKVLSAGTDMAWIIGLAVGVILCVVIVLLNVAMPKFKIMQKLVDKLNLVTREILTGLPVIRAFSREKHEEQRFDNANKDLTKTMLFTNRVMTFMMPLMMLIMNLITVLIIWVGADRISAGSLQVGDMMAFITYTMQIVMSFLMLTMISVMLPRAAVSAERIDEVINSKSSITDKENPEKLDKATMHGDVCFDNVSFHYPDADENVISDISFTAKHGETTAIIGSTGSGKSTLVHLIPRFFDVTEGKITIDGVDIRDVTQHNLRDVIGFVPQKGVLFSGTIESNIKFGGEDISDDNMRLAADISQSAEFIDAKPDKYSEPVAQGGTNVSGGQKQRLSIARAIAKQPKIYVFDDSFSALDYKTDVALRKKLAEKTKDSTVIIVAQRISTILHADQIIVLDEGRIVGKGTHEQLMESCEVYRQIAISQLSQSDLDKINNGVKEASDNE